MTKFLFEYRNIFIFTICSSILTVVYFMKFIDKYFRYHVSNIHDNDPYSDSAQFGLILKKKKSIDFFFILIIILIVVLTMINLHVFHTKTLASELFFPLMIPLNLRLLIQKYADFKQNLYNKITLKLLEISVINVIIKLWHRFLFGFRNYSVALGDYISKYFPMNMLALIISIIFSRLHIAGYLIIFCLSFLRLDFSVLSMLRFYKQYPDKLHNLYPINKRHMWSHAAKVVQEASSNPYVQSTGIMVAGALGWKMLDVHDTQADVTMRKAELEAENARHAQEMAMRKAELEAENTRHAQEMVERKVELEAEMAMRKAELEETRLARMSKND